MEHRTLRFNRHPLIQGGGIQQPLPDLVKVTPGLWNCDPDDAARYGGELTRAALGAMALRNDRKYVVVDTKVHMLMPGFWPAIPGWHTDGAPRGPNFNPAAGGPPDIWRQEDPAARSPRFHLLVTGEGCLTQFAQDAIDLSIPVAPTPDLYRHVSHLVNAAVEVGAVRTAHVELCTAWEWDWWALHQGVVAEHSEWRFLMRVTETDYLAPQRDLRQIIRTQHQVYVPAEFGW
jgi:hypothetical protein